jgi:hypothetical protein
MKPYEADALTLALNEIETEARAEAQLDRDAAGFMAFRGVMTAVLLSLPVCGLTIWSLL